MQVVKHSEIRSEVNAPLFVKNALTGDDFVYLSERKVTNCLQ